MAAYKGLFGAAGLFLLAGCADDAEIGPPTMPKPTSTSTGSDDSTTGEPTASSTGASQDSSSGGRSTGELVSTDALVCFSQILDEMLVVDLDDPSTPTAETLPTGYRVAAASVVGGVATLMVMLPSGDGGVARVDSGAASIGALMDADVEFAVSTPSEYFSSAPSTAGIVFSGVAANPLVCSRDNASDCTEGSAPEPPGPVACSDDGTCVAGGQTNGALRSADGGLTFAKQANDYILGPIVAAPGGRYAAFDNFNLDVKVSLDGGASWQTASQPGDVRSLEPRVWAGTSFLGTSAFQSGGIFSSADGTDWSSLDATLPVEVNRIVHTGVGDTVFAYAESTGESFVAENGVDFSAVAIDASFFSCPGIVFWFE